MVIHERSKRDFQNEFNLAWDEEPALFLQYLTAEKLNAIDEKIDSVLARLATIENEVTDIESNTSDTVEAVRQLK